MTAPITVSSRPWAVTGSSPLAVQAVETFTVKATSGTFTIEYKGNVSTALAFNISAVNLQAAFEALGNSVVAAGDVVITGGPGDATGSTPYTLTWLAKLGDVDLPQSHTSLLVGTATAVFAYTTHGAANKIVPVRYVPGTVQVGMQVIVPSGGGATVQYTMDPVPTDGGSWTNWVPGAVTAGTTSAWMNLPVTAFKITATTHPCTYNFIQ